MILTNSTQAIKEALFQFHRERGYQILKSFPLVSTDPTVFFVNATITPLKELFFDTVPMNFATVQKCFRLGGANDLGLIGKNPNCSSYFEMFGSGTFYVTFQEAINYLLDLLKHLGFETNKEYFVVPADFEFKRALESNGVANDKIFVLSQNQIFWQEWKFGKEGPVGKGLTVVYATGDVKASSIGQMECDYENFLELLNLIYIFGRDNDGVIIPVNSPGFELGMGIGRIAAALQNCNGYEVDNVRTLVAITKDYFLNQGYQTNESVIRICVDHLMSTCILLDEGLTPNNKGAGYVLRKLIRRLIENVWQSSGEPVPIENLVGLFLDEMLNAGYPISRAPNKIIPAIQKEEEMLRQVLENTACILRKKPNLSLSVLKDTYGISPVLINLNKMGLTPKKETTI